MAVLRIAAPAKLNLTLHITGRRDDGFHLLDSLMAFTQFGDVLEISPDNDLRLEVTGPLAASLGESHDDNLVLQAARLLRELLDVPEGAHIILHKHIPVGAGLGGGSADAAAALRGLRKLWQLNLDDDALRLLATQLGSDVPVCISSCASWVGGVGEKVTPVALPGSIWAVLVNPGVPLLTSDVYGAFSGSFEIPEEKLPSVDSPKALAGWLNTRHNALEIPATSLCPEIADILAALRTTDEYMLARMSGSGATCFALYASEEKAREATKKIQSAHPAWRVTATLLLDNRESYETQ